MMAATTHIRARELSIDEIASPIACTVSAWTSSELSTVSSPGGEVGVPLVTTVVMRGAPWKAMSRTSSTEAYTLGVPPSRDRPSVVPTTVS